MPDKLFTLSPWRPLLDMSFLEDADLAAALAFVDGFEQWEAQQQQQQVASEVEVATDASTAGSPAKKRKAKRSNAPAAMRLRRKRKAERLLLREQVAELEEELRLLQQQESSGRVMERALGAAGARVEQWNGVWSEIAKRMREERRRAEVENVQLRDILTKQVKFAQSLEKQLQSRRVFEGVDLIFHPRQPPSLPNPVHNLSRESILAGMEEKVVQIYRGMKMEIDREQMVAWSGSVSSTLSNKHRSDGTAYLEVTTTTPLLCGYDQSLQIVHEGMQRKETLSNKHLINQQGDIDRFCSKSYMVLLQDNHQNASLHGVYVMRKFEDSDHTAYVCTAITYLASDSPIRFRECGWMVLKRAPIDPHCKSVFRTCYRVYLERNELGALPNDALQVETTPIGRTERFVMSAYGRKTRSLLQNVQDILLDEVERAALRGHPEALQI